jgi:predicted O-methyltransferase YrrM
MNKLNFYFQIFKFALQHPDIGFDILQTKFDTKNEPKQKIREYEESPLDLNQLVEKLFPHESKLTSELRNELSDLEKHIESFIKEREKYEYPSKKKPYPLFYSLDNQSGLFLYALCVMTKPSIVVETGVAYGMSSAYILSALEKNKRGKLYSLDFTFRPWESKEMLGSIIPDKLKDRWELIFKRSSSGLHSLLESLGTVDIFIHDSQHTFRNMLFEFNTAWPFITRDGFLLSDDILRNNAFHQFCSQVKLKPLILKQQNELKSFLGILQKA